MESTSSHNAQHRSSGAPLAPTRYDHLPALHRLFQRSIIALISAYVVCRNEDITFPVNVEQAMTSLRQYADRPPTGKP